MLPPHAIHKLCSSGYFIFVFLDLVDDIKEKKPENFHRDDMKNPTIIERANVGVSLLHKVCIKNK